MKCKIWNANLEGVLPHCGTITSYLYNVEEAEYCKSGTNIVTAIYTIQLKYFCWPLDS